MSTNQTTLTVDDAFYYASVAPCGGCFWFYIAVLIFILIVVICLFAFGRDQIWPLEEEPRTLIKLRRHRDDVWLQENLSRAIAEYWAADVPKEWRVAEEVDSQMADDATSKTLENFNAQLELRRKTFIQTTRRNAFKNKMASEDSEWSVTLYDMNEGDQLDAERLLAQLVFVLPKPFVPESPPKAYLKEEVRVALFTMLRKIHFEGYDCHVAALVQSAVVVWNDGENVRVDGKPFYPAFPLLSLAEVGKALQTPDDEDAEMRRLSEPDPEVPFKMSYEDVLALRASIDREAQERRQRLDEMKQTKWTRYIARLLVNALTAPRVFEALEIMDKDIKVTDKNENMNELAPEEENRPRLEKDLNQLSYIIEKDLS